MSFTKRTYPHTILETLSDSLFTVPLNLNTPSPKTEILKSVLMANHNDVEVMMLYTFHIKINNNVTKLLT